MLIPLDFLSLNINIWRAHVQNQKNLNMENKKHLSLLFLDFSKR